MSKPNFSLFLPPPTAPSLSHSLTHIDEHTHTHYLEPTSVIRRQAKFSKNTVPAPTVAFLVLLVLGRRNEILEENSVGKKKKGMLKI